MKKWLQNFVVFFFTEAKEISGLLVNNILPKILVCLLAVSFSCSDIFSQTTVTYTQQTGYYASIFNDATLGCNTTNNGGTEVQQYAHTDGNKQTVAWRLFNTNGTNSGTNRTLQVGDVFTIQVYATSAYGSMGFSLNAGAAYGSWANRQSNSRVYFEEQGGSGNSWYMSTSSSPSFNYNTTNTGHDYKFVIALTSDKTADVDFYVDGGFQYRLYNQTLNGTQGVNIDGFSIYLNDDWNSAANTNIYWKQTTNVTNSKTANLGYYLTSGTYTPGVVKDGLDAASTVTNSINAVNIGGNSGSVVLLNQANTYTGATIINANATLQLGNATALGTTAAGTTITSGGVLDLNGTNYSNNEALTVNGTGISSNGAIINSSATAATYAGLLTLGSNSTIKGSAGTINFSNTGIITGGFNLTLGGAAGGIIAGVIQTSGGTVTKNDAGTWTLSGLNAYSGITTINSGILKLGAAGNGSNTPLGLPATGTTVASGGSLDLAGYTLGGGAAPVEALTISGAGYSSNGAIMNSGGSATYSGILTLGANSTINGGTGAITLNSGTAISGSGYTLTLGGAVGGTVSSIIGTGAGGLTKSDAGTWTLSSANTYTGTTTINSGILALGVNSAIKTGNPGGGIVLNGGTLSTGIYSEGSSSVNNIGTLTLNNNATLSLGSNTSNKIYFAASNVIGWTGTLTITGWTGSMGSAGTTSRIYFPSTAGLTTAQLAQITFSGFPAGAVLLSGSPSELVPAIVATTYYSQCSCSLNTLTNWNSSRTGGGYSPVSFAVVTGDKFIVQGTGGGLSAPHTITSSSNVTIGASGINVTLEVEGGGTLQQNSNITMSSGSTFKLDANSNFIQNSTNATSIVAGIEDWDMTSIVTFTNNGLFNNSTTITGSSYPNVIMNYTSGNLDANGVITTIGGWFKVDVSPKIFSINKNSSTTLTVADSVYIATGTLDLYCNASTNINTLQIGGNFRIANSALLTNTGGSSNNGIVNFVKNGTATYVDLNTTPGAGIGAKPINFVVKSPCVLDMSTYVMGPSTGTFNLNSGAGIITANTNATGALTLTGTNGSIQVGGTRTYNTAADYTFNGGSTQNTGNGFTGARNLTISNSLNVTQTVAASVSGVLNFTAGKLINTSSTKITITGSGSVTNAGSTQYIQGYETIDRTIAPVTTSTSATFNIGDASGYTPATINYSSQNISITASTSTPDHAQIATSDFDPLNTANRTWTLSGTAVTGGITSGTFTYLSGDLDPSATPTTFSVGNYVSSAWVLNTNSGTTTSTSFSGASFLLGDFQCGQQNCTTGTWKGTTSADWNVATNWCSGSVPTSSTNVTIPNVTNKPIISTANAVAKTVTIQSGASLTMTGIYNLTLSGNAFTNNAGSTGFVASSSTGALIFSGANATISGTTSLQNVQITGYSLDFGTNSTVNGTFTINNGGSVSSNAPIYNCSSTLKYSTTGTYNRGSEWVSGATSGQKGFPGSVQISNTTAFNYGTTSTATTICGDLTVDINTSFNLGASTAALTVPGNVIINGAFALSTASGGDLKVGGNFTVGAGTGPTGNGFPINNGRAVYFTGTSGTQVITKTGGGTVYFDKLIKSAGSTLQLNNSPGTAVKIISSNNNATSNVLELLNGTIDLQGQTFELNGSVANSTNIGVDGGTTRNITSSSGTATFAVTGTASAGSQNLNINVLTANSKLIFGTGVNVTTQVGLDFGLNGLACEIDGILQINTNGFVIGHSPDYGNSSTLIYNNGSGGFKRNLEWNTNTAGATGAGYPNNIIVQNNTPLTLNVTFAAPNALGCSGYIDIEGGSSMDMGSMPYSLTAGTNLTIGGTLILSSASGGDLNVGQNWDRAAAGVFTQNGRNVTFNGSADGTLTANGNGQLFSYVYLNKSGSGNKLTLLDNVSVSDETAFTQGTLDMGTKFFTILSTATKTARVGQSSSANTAFTYGAGNVTGQFIIQRYLPARRAWRLMAAPLKSGGGTHYINQAWQEGQGAGYDYAASGTPAGDTLSAGFATQITGGTTANGFDLSQQNKASILKFVPTNTSTFTSSGTWIAPANTNATSVNSQQGWMLFVRGDRINFGQITNQYKTPTITTLRPRGQLNVGTVTVPSSSTLSGIQIVGNPYASAVDFNALSSTGGVVTTKYWAWDPQLGGSKGVGAFVGLSWNGTDYTRSVPVTGTGTSTYDNRYIPSGAAVMVDFGGGGTITFNEANKVAANTTTAFRPVSNIRTTLNSVDPDGTTFVTDGVVNLFNDNYDTAVNAEDVIKLANIESENFSIKRNDALLSIEKTKFPKATDTVFYNWSKMKVRDYQLEISTDSLQNSWINLFLEDNYKRSQTPVSVYDTTRYNFTIVVTDSGTFKANRFRLIMKYDPPAFSNLNVYKQYSDVALQWQIVNEKPIDKYVIERSSDGANFEQVGTVKDLAASGSSIYQWLDTKPVIGDNFYRVYGVGIEGQKFYSAIEKITIHNSQLSVYPNPVTDGQVGVQLTNMPKGNYSIVLMNNLGQIIAKKELNHLGGDGSVKVPLVTVKVRGVYQMRITRPDNTSETVKVVY